MPIEDNDLPSPTGRTRTLTASMSGVEPSTRVALEQDGKDINLKWEEKDAIDIAFVQGDLKIKSDTVPKMSKVSANGKTAEFSITIPEGIDESQAYQIYGVYGGGGIEITKAGDVYAKLPSRPGWSHNVMLLNVKSKKEVMLNFSLTIEPGDKVGSVKFKHLGSLFVIYLKTTGASTSKNINGVELEGIMNENNKHWAYNSYYPDQRYDLVENEFINNAPTNTSNDNYLHFKANKVFTLMGGTSRVFWAWYPPLPNKVWPELKLLIKTGTDDKETDRYTSANSMPVRKDKNGVQIAPVAGKTYNFYAEFKYVNRKWILNFTEPFTIPSILPSVDLFNQSMNDKEYDYRIPAMVTAPNGDLITAIDERQIDGGDLSTNPDINIVIRRSRDNGKTWSKIESIVDYTTKGQSASDPSMIVDKVKGQIFLFYNYMDWNKNNKAYYYKVIKSTDNGENWRAPKDITTDITKTEWGVDDFRFITSGRGIQTTAGAHPGRLIHTLVRVGKGVNLFYSDDYGKSWLLNEKQISPADESKIVELDDGSWMVSSRVNKKLLTPSARYAHTSTNEGINWKSEKTPLEDPACNASIIRYTAKKDGYDKNRLLFSNPKSSSERRNMTVRIGYDEGEKWSEGKTVYTGMSSYSSMTILENGEIGLLFEMEGGSSENPFMSFSLDWLTDGEDTYTPPSI